MIPDGSCACVQPPFDRDFPSLAGRSTASKTWHSGNGPSEQQWTRLADAPEGAALSPRVSNPRPAEPAEPAKPAATKSVATADASALQPRMADTLQQVQSLLFQTIALGFNKTVLTQVVLAQKAPLQAERSAWFCTCYNKALLSLSVLV